MRTKIFFFPLQQDNPRWMPFMTTKPGEVYRVDLGAGGKVRMMLVVSREDDEAPRALSLCVPITSASRKSDYEVELPSRPFFRMKSYANVQGLQAIQHHELNGPLGTIFGEPFEKVREGLRYAMDL
jgi:mRNA-degrading endonuclease toxin of MazEF toxin-antitoxin module